MASQLSASGINKALDSNRPGRNTNGERGSTPGSPPSSRNQSSPTPSDNSMGALDLTPKSSGPPSITQSSPTMMMAQGMGVGQLHPHPLSMFPNFPMLPHGPIGSSTPMMNSALNSLAQSVLPATPFNPLGISGELLKRRLIEMNSGVFSVLLWIYSRKCLWLFTVDSRFDSLDRSTCERRRCRCCTLRVDRYILLHNWMSPGHCHQYSWWEFQLQIFLDTVVNVV